MSERGWRRLLRLAAAAGIAATGFLWFVPVVQFEDPLSTVVLDRHRELLGAAIAADGQWRFGVADTVPDRYAAALTTFEDRRFFYHPGIDPIAVARAIVQNVREGERVSGGSTITMQVVRLARKGRRRSLKEKAIEAVLAARLEVALTKRQILALHAAYAPFGGNTVGLDAAAWRYFGRAPDRLSWAETAMLAVLPNAPSLVHPGRNREALKRKRDRLLDVLHEDGVIDAMTCRLAKEEELPPAPQPISMLAPHLLARAQAGRRSARWKTGDPSPWVHTSLDRVLQVRAGEILARHQRTLAQGGVHNAAALVLEVDTGAVAAYVGNVASGDGRDHGQHVDVIPAPRSTGSTLKPLLFAAMLESGDILPGQIVPDVPSQFGAFHPENFDRAYGGAVPAETALARSLNVPAVRMLRSYGVDRFHATLRTLGLTSLTRTAREYGLALILGGAEGTLWDVTGVYAGLARVSSGRGGFAPPSYAWPPRDAPGSDREPALHAAACHLTLAAMLEVERPGDEMSWRAFRNARKIAWKTGTSYGFRDAWAVGVTPRYAVGVWVGNADGEGRPGLTGYSAAAPILFELHGLLPAGGDWMRPDADLDDIDVCASSGMRAGPHCARRRGRLVPRRGLGSPPCSYCRRLHVDASGRWQVHGDCEAVARLRAVSWFVLPPSMEVHYRRRHSDYEPPPPLRADCRQSAAVQAAAALSCVYPREDAQVYVPVEMDGRLGRVVVEAAHRRPQSRVYWHIDDEFLGETYDIHQLAVAPSPGAHVLTLVDADGETVERRFTVITRTSS